MTTAESHENVALIQRQFDAFGRGDVDAALAAVAENVDWQAPVGRRDQALPWSGRRHGRQQVLAYFERLSTTVRPEPFEDLTFTAEGDRVVVEGRNSGTALATGRRYEHEWVMIFTIRDGRVVRFRHYYDPADVGHALD